MFLYPQGGCGAHYPGICRELPAVERRARMLREPYALRLDVSAAWRHMPAGFVLSWFDRARGKQVVERAALDDVVLARSLRGIGGVGDLPRVMPASYHLCVTQDDTAQGVTLVTRGEDLLAVTGVQRLLQTLMGWEEPEYCHHRILVDGQGKRLAKRDNAPSLRDMRAAGVTRDEILKHLEDLNPDFL